MTDQERIKQLEQALQIERTKRQGLERQLAKLTGDDRTYNHRGYTHFK